MSSICIVCGQVENETITFFHFPKSNERSNHWQIAMFGSQHVPIKMGSSQRICSRHFSQSCFQHPKSSKLNRNAIPNLLPSFPVVQFKTDAANEEQQQPVSSFLPQIKDLQLDCSTPVFKDINDFYVISSLTRKKRLAEIISRVHEHIDTLKSINEKYMGNMRDVISFALKNPEIGHKIFKNLPSTAKKCMIMQLQQAQQLSEIKHWEFEEKALSLMLYVSSPLTYSLLGRFMPLPPKSILASMLESMPFGTGINESLFKHVSKSMSTDGDRYCVLTFDEIKLRRNLHFSRSNGELFGVEDYGNTRIIALADHALIFMLQGIWRTWKQPIAFYFTKGISAAQLVKIISDIIHMLIKYDMKIVATVSDMATRNVNAIKLLGATTTEPYYFVDQKKVVHIYDFPHLLKSTRNMFAKYDVEIDVDSKEHSRLKARWADIEKAFAFDQKSPENFRYLYKLRPHDFAPKLQNTMGIRTAAQTLSHSVAAYIYFMRSPKYMDSSAIATATFAQEVNVLFDSVNSRPHIGDQSFEANISLRSGHLPFWRDAIKKIERWEFQTPSKSKGSKKRPRFQNGWIHSLNGMVILTYDLKKQLKHLRGRSFMLDSLENLFGAIRFICGDKKQPTCEQVVVALKTLILNNLTLQCTIKYNCEDDRNSLLTNMQSFVEKKEMEANETSSKLAIEVAEEFDLVDHLSVAFISAFIAKKISEAFDCSTCRYILLTTQNLQENLFIAMKECEDSKKLMYPSWEFCQKVGESLNLVEANLRQNFNHKNIFKEIVCLLEKEVCFKFACKVHEIELQKFVISAISNIAIPYYCKIIERELKLQASVMKDSQKQ